MPDYPVTINRARTNSLSLQEQARGFSHKFNIKAADVAVSSATAATDTVTFTLGSLPSRYVLNNALVNITTAFAGTTAMTVQVGTTTTSNSLVTAQSVLTAGVLAGVPTTATIRTATATANLVAVFTNATGGSPSALTAGELDIYLNIVDLSQPDRLG